MVFYTVNDLVDILDIHKKGFKKKEESFNVC